MSNDNQRKSVLQVSPQDNLLVALKDLGEGEQVQWDKGDLTVAEKVPAKHKLTISDLSKGDPVYMYGVLVGEDHQGHLTGQKSKHSKPRSSISRIPTGRIRRCVDTSPDREMGRCNFPRVSQKRRFGGNGEQLARFAHGFL